MTTPSPPPPRCAPMVAADLAAVGRLADQALPGSWSAAALRDELARPDRRYLVARVDAEVVGYAGVAGLAGDGHVMALVVASEQRRRGIGAHLLRASLAVARDELGTDRATLEVRASNHAALALYGRAGFRVAGRRERYYPDGEAALVLWCDDVAVALRRLGEAARTDRDVPLPRPTGSG